MRTYDWAAKMSVLGGFLLGASFFLAKLEGFPPSPLHLTRTFFLWGLPAPLPNLLPVTLRDSTMIV